jgi:hypothetical protein
MQNVLKYLPGLLNGQITNKFLRLMKGSCSSKITNSSNKNRVVYKNLPLRKVFCLRLDVFIFFDAMRD